MFFLLYYFWKSFLLVILLCSKYYFHVGFFIIVGSKVYFYGFNCFLITALFCLLTWIDLLHYRAFQNIPSVLESTIAFQIPDVRESIFASVNISDLILPFVGIMSLLLFILIQKSHLEIFERKKFLNIFFVLIFFSSARYSMGALSSRFGKSIGRKVANVQIDFKNRGIWYAHLNDLSQQLYEWILLDPPVVSRLQH